MRIAWRSLWRGWRRSAIVVTAVTVGLVACLFLVSFSNAFVEELVSTAVETRLANVAVMARGYAANPDVLRNLPGDGVIAQIAEGFPGAHASPRLLGDGLIQSARKSSRIALAGVEPERESRVSVVSRSFVAGGWPAAGAGGGARRLGELALGGALAERLGVRVGDKVVIHTPGESGLGAFRVSGIFRTASSSFDKTQVFVSLADAQRLLDVPGRVTEVALALDDPEKAAELAAFARAELTRALPDVELDVLTWREREPRLAAMLELMGNTRWVAYAAVFIGMAFGIANALLMAVYERIREFGVLRSLGLPATHLVWLVLLESLMLTLGGVVVGLAVGVPIVRYFSVAGLDLSQFSAGLNEFGIGAVVHLRLRGGDMVSPLYIAVLTALVAAAWPAWKAARLRPAEALRHV